MPLTEAWLQLKNAFVSLYTSLDQEKLNRAAQLRLKGDPKTAQNWVEEVRTRYESWLVQNNPADFLEIGSGSQRKEMFAVYMRAQAFHQLLGKNIQNIQRALQFLNDNPGLEQEILKAYRSLNCTGDGNKAYFFRDVLKGIPEKTQRKLSDPTLQASQDALDVIGRTFNLFEIILRQHSWEDSLYKSGVMDSPEMREVLIYWGELAARLTRMGMATHNVFMQSDRYKIQITQSPLYPMRQKYFKQTSDPCSQ